MDLLIQSIGFNPVRFDKKTATGMLKLLRPDLTVEEAHPDKLSKVVTFAVEMRKRVIDQLAVTKPEEFGGVSYNYEAI
jgi:predicted ATP-dependent Lon-type protease